MNAGQMCWANSRLVVHEDVADEMVEKMAEIAENIPPARERHRRRRTDGTGRQ